ncbi:17092_t:CDS:2, partial [Racocetra fulgida]
MSSFYKIGSCFSYQKCLLCFTDRAKELCECDTTQKPSRVKNGQIYSQVYDPNKTSLSQKLFLQNSNRVFTYGCDFNNNFKLTDFSDKSFDFSIDSALLSKTSDLYDFNIFHSDLIQHVCNCINDNIEKSEIEISYKVNGRGQAMALEDSSDYVAFITEYRNLDSKKHMVLSVSLKSSNKRKFKKSINENDSDKEMARVKSKKFKHNRLSKESSLTSDEIKLAEIISQFRSKYQCGIHTTSCYIDGGKHLQLTPAR